MIEEGSNKEMCKKCTMEGEAMSEKEQALEARVRETPLPERLRMCRKMLGKMCSEGRPPRMCIPVQYDDEDFFIATTLKDALEALEAKR